MARLSAVVDFLVRAAFFALAPFVAVFVAMLFPVTGAIVQVAAALAVFFAGEAIRRYSLRVPFVAKLLANELKFESYYREHPPRPFLYYVAYPLAIGLVSIGFATARLERRRDPIVSFATRTRVRLRTARAAQRAIAAQTKALRAAWKALPADKRREDIDADGKVEGAPLETARQALIGFYKNDEAHTFDLWYTRSHKRAILVLFFEAERSHAPIWLAIDHTQKATHDVARLPAGAFKAMRHASR